MSYRAMRAVPIDRCRHRVRRYKGASSVIEIASGGRPVDVPMSMARSRFDAAHHPLLAFAAGLVAGSSFVLAIVLG